MPSFYHKLMLLGILFCLYSSTLYSQSEINGYLKIDSSWHSVVYLSIIPNFDQLNSMSNQMIIDKAEIDREGRFSFKTDYLPSKFQFYRMHLSKKGDPPASLIIGGKDENHFFLIANQNSQITIKNNISESNFADIQFENSPQSQLLNEVNKMLLYVDTTSFYNTPLKRDLMEKALDEKLRQFADTCSYPLVALYAINKTNFESHIAINPDFYLKFLAKWDDEATPYFVEFRKKVPTIATTKNYSVLYLVIGFIVGLGLMFVVIKKRSIKTTNLLHDLTVQERRVFSLLQQEKSNKEISDELNISLSTVKSHINNIFSKLDIKSRKEVFKLSV